MSEDTPFDANSEAKEPVRPESEVRIHLWSGYDLAYMDLEETVGVDVAKLVHSIGEIGYTALSRLFIDPSDPVLPAKLAKTYPGLAELYQHDPDSLLEHIFEAYRSGSSPVFTHSIDLHLAEEAIIRAEGAVGRLRRLADVLGRASLPPRVREYLAEVVHTFLFGFDAACMALARSAFEQMAREVLVKHKVYTEARLNREKPTAFNLFHELKRNGLLDTTASKAETLIARGNTIAHKHMYEDRIMQQQAVTSIAELVAVLTELALHLSKENPDTS